jgi:hypothetical protein
MTKIEIIAKVLGIPVIHMDEPPQPVCADWDDDCPRVKDKVACWLYQPERGRCPLLTGQHPK